jgi:hypothetical protein
MVLVPGPHLLNSAIDLVRTRIALGVARLTYAGTAVLMFCFRPAVELHSRWRITPGPQDRPQPRDVVAAGCAVASLGTLFSIP